jgi:competence protein ComEC
MSKRPWITAFVAGLVSCLWLDTAFADGEASPLCVVPSSDVVTSVSVRATPSTSSALVGRLLPGQQVALMGEVPSWYLVELSDGTQGHVAKRWADTLACGGLPPAPAPAPQPSEGPSFELDVIDVGTGLSVFVRGPDFSLLYDAGSNDDKATGAGNRTAAFLATVHPDVSAIDHVVLSHPHQDHVELLADIVRGHHIGDVWDSGAPSDICGYRAFLMAVADTGVRYHTAIRDEGNHTIPLGAQGDMPRASRNQPNRGEAWRAHRYDTDGLGRQRSDAIPPCRRDAPQQPK